MDGGALADTQVTHDPSAKRARAWAAVELGLVGLLALAVRLVFLDHTPDIDEFNHVLAARSLIDDGTLSINGGEPYTRAWMFTYLVAAFFRVFGESLVVARLPAVLAGAGLVLLIFAWTRSVAGRLAAWTTAVLLCLAPVSLYLSQISRFYTLQALLFWCGVVTVYWLLSGSRSRRQTIAATVGCLLAFGLALHLQILTIVGLGAVVLWSAVVGGPRAVRRLLASRFKVAIVLGTLAIALFAVVALAKTGAPAQALELMQQVDPWAEPHRGNVRFYHWLFEDQYTVFWSLFPVAALLALATVPRAASLCITILGVALVIQSLAAWKAERYIFYALPAFFALWGMAVGQFVPKGCLDSLSCRHLFATP